MLFMQETNDYCNINSNPKIRMLSNCIPLQTNNNIFLYYNFKWLSNAIISQADKWSTTKQRLSEKRNVFIVFIYSIYIIVSSSTISNLRSRSRIKIKRWVFFVVTLHHRFDKYSYWNSITKINQSIGERFIINNCLRNRKFV